MATKKPKKKPKKKSASKKPSLADVKRDLEKLNRLQDEIEKIRANIQKYIDWNAKEGQSVRQNMRIRGESDDE